MSERDKNWEIVVAYLHHDGHLNNRLTTPQKQRVRLEGDGMGDVKTRYHKAAAQNDDKTMESMIDLVWDWSHIRDSSPNAIARMANQIKIYRGLV